jgi:cysteinyl-tRNA synthetase
MGVAVHNTLTRRKEELVPREAGKIAMYVCGPTVYSHIHVGNARAFVVFDVIRRYLRWRRFEVLFVENYTDIDDKIIARAKEEGRPPEEVAQHYALAFEEVMAALDIAPPNILVKATDHIAEMLTMIEGLVNKGFAYESEGNVWFAVEKSPEYGKLSGRSIEDLRAGERVEPDPSKRHPLDFALWKAAKPDEPKWPSPWGPGRPGWHIECSAMSVKHLGMGFDIHGGGYDLVFPHHENEIAQSEAFYGDSPFVRYWIHNGLVNIEQAKMSKSLGNIILLRDLLRELPAGVVRLLSITAHYRRDIDFGEEQLANAAGTYDRFDVFFQATGALGGDPSAEGREFLERFREAMDDDFNTPAALSVIHELVGRGNLELEGHLRGEQPATERLRGLVGPFLEMTDVLGILPAEAADVEPEEVERLIRLRDEARSQGHYDQADEMRKRLLEQGVVLEDTPSGTRWRRRRGGADREVPLA